MPSALEEILFQKTSYGHFPCAIGRIAIQLCCPTISRSS